MNEPAARLIYLFPGTATFPKLVRNLEGRSRLCEIHWVDRAMFGNKIVVIAQAFYGAVSGILDQEIQPGGLGEQLVFSDSIADYEALQVGDAVFKVIGVPDLRAVDPSLDGSKPEFWARELKLVEEGLVEPGAPVQGI